MKRGVVQTERAPKAIGPYSQATKANGIVCISGQLPIDPVTGIMPNELVEQVHQSVKNVIALAEEAGGGKDSILKCGLFIKDMSKFQTINEVYQEYFPEEAPARFVVEVAQLPKGAQIEIDADAAVE